MALSGSSFSLCGCDRCYMVESYIGPQTNKSPNTTNHPKTLRNVCLV
jgi:hypothetical protein